MIRLGNILLLGMVLMMASADAHPNGTIEGRIWETKSGKPVVGANVLIEETSIGAATDGIGRYSFRVPSGKHRVIVRMMGYEEEVKDVIIIDGQATFIDFCLETRFIPLDEIVVTAEREAICLVTTTTVITQEDIRARESLTVADALKVSPGVHVTMRCPYEGTGVYIRGFERHQTKVLIDGVPVYDPFRKVFDLSMIPAGNIAEIKIIKGPSSVLYGANTLGGVMNIVTKRRTENPFTEVSCSFGRDRTMNYRINHGACRGSFDYWISGSYQSSSGFRMSKNYDNDPEISPYEDGGLRENSDYKRRGLSFRLGFAPSETQGVNLSFVINDGEAGLPVPPNPTKLTEGPNSYHWRFKEKDRWQTNLTSSIEPRDWLTIKGCGFYSRTKHTLEAYSDELFAEVLYRNHSQSPSAGGFLHTRLHHRHGLLKLGVGYQWDQHCRQDSRMKGSAVYELATMTSGIEEELSFGTRLSAVIGASYDILDPLKVAEAEPGPKRKTLNPQAGLILKLGNNTNLHASVGKKTSFPTMRDLYWRKEEGGCWVGNPRLWPEEALTYELGIEHEFGDCLKTELALFRSDLRNLITTVALFDQGQYWRRDNIEKALLQGVEASIRFHPIQQLSGSISYTYLDTENKTSGPLRGEELLYRPKHRASLDLRYRFNSGLRINLQSVGSSKKSYYWAPPDLCLYEIPPEARPKGEIPGYLLSNGKLSYGVSGYLDLFLSVKNILDLNYLDRGSPKMGYEPMPGRSVTVGFNFGLR